MAVGHVLVKAFAQLSNLKGLMLFSSSQPKSSEVCVHTELNEMTTFTLKEQCVGFRDLYLEMQ